MYADFKHLNPHIKPRFCSHSRLQGYCLLWLWLYNVIITYDYNINYLNTTNINAQIIQWRMGLKCGRRPKKNKSLYAHKLWVVTGAMCLIQKRQR